MTGRSSPLIAIFGPTAVGKTEVAIAVASQLAETGVRSTAVSADAYQLYRGLEILSGAPSPSQREQLEHLLVASHEASDEMSAGLYAAEAHRAIDGLIRHGVVPIVVGGAGLYMQAALCDLEMRPSLTPEQEEAVAARYGPAGTGELHRELARRNPGAAAGIDEGDRYRVTRALALDDAGAPAAPGERFWEAAPRRPTLMFGLTRDREELYSRIDRRTDEIAAGGAAREIAQATGASQTARRIIGFSEIPAGEIGQMKTRTRRYAKRQLTWMRRIPDLHTIDLTQTGTQQAGKEIADAWRQAAE